MKTHAAESFIENSKKPALTKITNKSCQALKIFTAKELLEKELKPLEYIVPDILPDSGVFILAGASKMGKSWFAMDMTLHISEGKSYFNRQIKQANVLYFDLESGERSLKSRIEKLSGEIPFPDKWFYSQHISSIEAGFREQIEEAITRLNIKVVVIDVFVKIRSKRDKTVTEYKHDYDDISVLKELAEKHGIVFLIIIHLTKFRHEDPFNMVCGSVGINGTSDGTIILIRERMSDEASLFISGRELEKNEYKIEFDKNLCRWRYVCTSEEAKVNEEEEKYSNNPIVRTIKDILKDCNIWNSYTGELNIEMHKRINLSDCNLKEIPTNARATGEIIRKYTYRLKQDGIFAEVGERKNKGIPLLLYKK